MTACFFITGSNDPDYTIVFWYSIVAVSLCQENLLKCIFLAGAELYKTGDHIYINPIRIRSPNVNGPAEDKPSQK
jgi:hypothetical protein